MNNAFGPQGGILKDFYAGKKPVNQINPMLQAIRNKRKR